MKLYTPFHRTHPLFMTLAHGRAIILSVAYIFIICFRIIMWTKKTYYEGGSFNLYIFYKHKYNNFGLIYVFIVFYLIYLCVFIMRWYVSGYNVLIVRQLNTSLIFTILSLLIDKNYVLFYILCCYYLYCDLQLILSSLWDIFFYQSNIYLQYMNIWILN